MARHLIIGAGPIGRAATTALQKRGHTLCATVAGSASGGDGDSVAPLL